MSGALNPLEGVTTDNITWAFENRHLVSEMVAMIEVPRKWRKANYRVSPAWWWRNSGDQAPIRAWARREMPIQTHEVGWYSRLCRYAAFRLEADYNALRDKAFRKIHGRDYRPSDYIVSCVCRPEFPTDVKEELRRLYHEAVSLSTLSEILKLIPKRGSGRLPK